MEVRPGKSQGPMKELLCYAKGDREELSVLLYFMELVIYGPESLSSLSKMAGLNPGLSMWSIPLQHRLVRNAACQA